MSAWRRIAGPLLTDDIDLASAHPPEEIARRLDARTRWGRWTIGWGVAVRRRRDGYRLAVRSTRYHGGRPVARVRVRPDGDGARLEGVIGPTRRGRVAIVGFWALAVGLVPGVAVRAPRDGVEAVALLGMAAAVVALPYLISSERDELRAVLHEVVR